MTTTNVPPVLFTDAGFVAPAESAVLAGVQGDLNAAFGGKLNLTSPATPQNQLATTEAAIIGNANDLLVALFNGVDPAYASGRMQDALARIYFLSRIAAKPTRLQLLCRGLAGVAIPLGSLVQDTAGNTYVSTAAGTIPVGGSITLPFENTAVGPIPAPASVTIYQAVTGWDSAAVSSSVLGNAVEGRASFAARMSSSVAANALNFVQACQGALLSVSGVESAYTTENYNRYPTSANPTTVIKGSISGTTLTVTQVISGTVATGLSVNLAANSIIGVTLPTGITIVSGAGSTWTVSGASTVPSGTTLNLGGVVLQPNSIYACVYGPEALESDIAQAVWSKKPPGCGYTGNTTVTVYDTSAPYPAPGIPYDVTYEAPTAVPIYVQVAIANSSVVPANALTLIQQSVANAFSGADGGAAAQIGENVLASRFVSGIASLGPWAQILFVSIGASNAAPAATSTASAISGTVLTVGGSLTGSFAAGQILTGTGILPGTFISSLGSGTGGAGTYNINQAQTVSSEAINSMSAILNNIQMRIDQMPTYVSTNVILRLI